MSKHQTPILSFLTNPGPMVLNYLCVPFCPFSSHKLSVEMRSNRSGSGHTSAPAVSDRAEGGRPRSIQKKGGQNGETRFNYASISALNASTDSAPIFPRRPKINIGKKRRKHIFAKSGADNDTYFACAWLNIDTIFWWD